MKGWIKYNYVNEAWGRKTSWAALISREGINNQIHNFRKKALILIDVKFLPMIIVSEKTSIGLQKLGLFLPSLLA